MLYIHIIWKIRPLALKDDSAVGGSILDSAVFFSLYILNVRSFAHPFIKFQHYPSLFSVCTVSASYVNGPAVLSINLYLQVTVNHHDDT